MQQFGGKDSKRHFTVVMGGKEHGLYVSSTPSSAAKKAVTKLCTANKSKKVEFSIREITQGSKKKTYGPYEGHIEKLKEPIELKGRVIKHKPVAKLSGKTGAKKGGMRGGTINILDYYKKIVGIVKHSIHDERYGTGIVESVKQSFSDKTIEDRQGLIIRFNEAFRYIGQVGYGLKHYIDLVKEWYMHKELIFVLALENSQVQVTSYLLANGITIYPMCLRFICRLVLNDMFKEKEDFYCLLKYVYDKANLYWGQEIETILPDMQPIFIPGCLLEHHLQFPYPPQANQSNNIFDTLSAWFGIMNPNELGGLQATKRYIIDYLKDNPQLRDYIFGQLKILYKMQRLSQIVIRQNYNQNRNNLTVGSISELINPNVIASNEFTRFRQ
jgi:hypothetical protein